MSRSLSVSSKFFCSSFKVSGLTLRYVIHFEFVFVYCEIQVQFQASACKYPVFPVPFIKGNVFSPTCFCPFFKKSPEGYTFEGLFLDPLFCHNVLPLSLCTCYHAIFVAMVLQYN
jgi:hypothetical protein